MKRAFVLLCSAAVLVCACEPKAEPELPSKDETLSGEKVDVGSLSGFADKLFVLNEGGMGSNNATLDFLRMSDGSYVTGAFRKMNPDAGAGLGDVGNDIAVNGDELWIVVNNSGIVEVLSAVDETEIAAVAVPTPRGIAFDDKYAYVTSWAGAYASGSYDSNGNYSLTDYKNPKGQVYRIDLSSKKVDGSVEVGYQPEGIAYYDGKLYVANSGGISSQLPPNYAYDNTLSIIDTRTFSVSQTVTVEVNLKNVYSDGKGNIYVSSLGNYYDVHSGLYSLPASNPSSSLRVGSAPHVKEEATYVSCSFISGDTVYCIGCENEFDWYSPRTYYVWSFCTTDNTSGEGKLSFYPLELSGTPYGMAVLEDSSDAGSSYVIVGDAGDYFNPGTVSCYNLYGEQKLWSVTAGVCPGHFAVL